MAGGSRAIGRRALVKGSVATAATALGGLGGLGGVSGCARIEPADAQLDWSQRGEPRTRVEEGGAPGDDEVLPPNVVFIMADDLGYGDVGAYGQELIATPSIDALAAEGLRFTTCYAGTSVCAPSRSVLLTGQHSGHTRVRANTAYVGGDGPQGRVPLAPEDVTFAELLRRAGYVTGMYGKWGLGEPDSTGLPNLQGFDEWLGFLNQRRAHDYYPPYIWHNQERYPLAGNQDGERGDYVHDVFTEFALAFIRSHRDRPFLLFLPYTAPHSKYEVPSLGAYAEQPWSRREQTYAAMVTRLDRDVGRIVERLADEGLAKSTLVLFCSDHGPANRRDGLFRSAGSLRGRKRTLYEGGLRVPMIARMPGSMPAGKVSDAPWYFADVLPTLAELADVRPPAGIDGISMLETLLGGTPPPAERTLYWEQYEGGYAQALRRGPWKAILFAGDRRPKLYNLDDDPGETTDVAAEHHDVSEALLSAIAAEHEDSPHWPTS